MHPVDALIAAHGRRLMGLLRRLLGDHGLAEDAWQETWAAAWKAGPRLRAGADPWPYLRQTAVRKAIDLQRRARGPVLVTGTDPEGRVESMDRVPEVDLEVLPFEQRACLVLFFWEGLAVSAIAEALRVPAGTVKVWMFRARARLRGVLCARKEAR